MYPLVLLLALSLPVQFNYNGVKWQLVSVHKIIMNDGDNAKYLGYTDCGWHVVKLYVDRPERQVKETLQHELMHVITNCDTSSRPTHELIKEFSTGLDNIKHDNPRLRRVLP